MLGAVGMAVLAGGPIAVDGGLLDVLVAARARLAAGAEDPSHAAVAVIAIDPRSLDEPELAPYPRVFLAPIWEEILDATVRAGARAVAFDVLFSYTANRFLPDFDAPFIRSLDRHRERVVLVRAASTLPAAPFLAALRNDPGALGLGEFMADPDGRYRHVKAVHDAQGGERVPSFASAVIRRAGGPAVVPDVLLAPTHHVEAIPAYALIDVLRCARREPGALRSAFAGKAVLIGTTLPGEDRRVTSTRLLPAPPADTAPLARCGLRRLGASNPDAESVPGVFIHAAAVDAVLRGQVPVTAPLAGVVATTAITAGAAAALGLLLTPIAALAGVLILGAVLFSAAILALTHGVWLPLALPLAALAAAPAIAYAIRYVVEERARHQVVRAFSHYLSPAVVARLAEDPAALALGGEVRDVTVMFADLSGFTALSGRVAPEELTAATNEYLGYIVEQVEATGGYVDKFLGDAVMALWGAPAADPRHAGNATRAALAAVERVRSAASDAAARGHIGFAVKIGLHSGRAVVGNVGTANRYNYTAIGETVNVAARLESVPALYGCAVVASGTTAEAASDFVWLEIDTIRVKGRDEPVRIYQPLGPAPATAPQTVYVEDFARALADYRLGRFAQAADAWAALGTLEAAPAMSTRARALAAAPPPAWDGVWSLPSK